MADRSTAAVGVANEGGETLPAAELSGATSGGTTTDDQTGSTPDGAMADDAPKEHRAPTTVPADAVPAGDQTAPGPVVVDRDTTKLSTVKASDKATDAPAKKKPVPRAAPPELHSGHKLARRYQLAECVTRVDGFSSWRAVDEKLRRAVGIHLLPADHQQARNVLAAARSAALLGDPRFVQVLDAVEEDDLVYVIHEWLPDATSLADLLAAGPLEPHEAYQMASQVSQGMAAAHREGLAHLRLDPGAVLRTVSGQYRIRGLAVAAALRGLSSEQPQRQDTEAIGALLYASLTQRWPYEEDAHGLAGLPKGVGLVAPDQVRAGVHRGLSEVAMRALVNDGATASREESPCTTPEELAKAVAGVPRIRPPEHAAPVYRPTAFQQPPPPPGAPTRAPLAAPAPPPPLSGRTGKALKGAVAGLLTVAIGLGSWQLADALQSRDNRSARTPSTGQQSGQATTPPPVGPVKIVGAEDFDPLGDHTESHQTIDNVYDHDPSTFWQTQMYLGRPDFGGLKSGVGVILDLGSAHNVSGVKVDFIGGDTSVELMAAERNGGTMPTELDDFTKVASTDGTEVTLKPTSKVNSRYLLVWLTKLPPSDGAYRGKIAEISVTG
ncbi:protein kinase family protein [Streptomyces sp. NBC_01190]|nr:protein kinase family protein [Streptomyces sp. NBC_01190]